MCPKCRAWDHPEGSKGRFLWQGSAQEYVALSDRQVTFANHLARRLKERFPDKDLYVSLIAYGNSLPAPVAAVPDANVIIVNVAHIFHDLTHQRYNSIGEVERQSFIDWSKAAKNQIWRPNLGNHAGWKQGGPVDLRRGAENFQMLAGTGSIGVYLDYVWLYWSTQGPLYYLMAQLAWNPRADAQAVMNDYYKRGFGPAAEAVKAYWEWQEIPCRAMVVDGRTWVEAFGQDWFVRAVQLLNQAESALVGAPEKYVRRLSFVRAGFEFLRLQTENRALLPGQQLVVKKGRNKPVVAVDAADLKKARANWVAMQELASGSFQQS